MKNRTLKIILSAFLLLGMSAGCDSGGREEEEGKTEAVSEPASAEAAQASSETVFQQRSDEGAISMETLRARYENLSDYYDTINNAYQKEEIARNAEVEEALTGLRELLDQYGEAVKGEVPPEEREDMMANLNDIGKALDSTLENVNYLYEDQVTPEMRDQVNEHYAKMVELYNAMIEYYASHELTADGQRIISTVQESMDRIDRADISSIRSRNELNEVDQQILDVIEFLDEVGTVLND